MWDGEYLQHFVLINLTYIYSNLEPSIAKKLAAGDIDPVTLLPMEDINISFMPRGKPLAPISEDNNRRDKGKGKVVSTPKKGGILSFFGSFFKVSLYRPFL